VSFLRRVLLVAAIAALAVVPLRAFGVVGASPPGLTVTASLGGCGVGGEGIVCQIDASFTGAEDADYYTASVTRADGSVQDLGTVGSGEGGGSVSVSVPYVGAGNYAVTVSAWGTPDDDEEKPELLEREKADTTEKAHTGKVTVEPADEEPDAAGEEEQADGDGNGSDADPAPAEPVPTEPEPETLPECRPDAAAAAPEAPMDGGESPEAEAQPATPPPAPVVECTTPSSDSNGPCCPPGV